MRNGFHQENANYKKRDEGIMQLSLIASVHKMRKFLEPLVKRCAEDFTLDELQPMFDVLNSEVVAALMLYKSVGQTAMCHFRVSREQCPVAVEARSLRGLAITGVGKQLFSYHVFVTCIHCNLKRCIECNGTNIMPGVCSAAKNMNVKEIEDSVRALLDRI